MTAVVEAPIDEPNVIRHRYGHRGAISKLFACRDPEILVDGPAGTGKSRGCLEKLYVAALKYPKMRGLIVRKTQVSMTTTALVTWTEKVATQSIEAKQAVWFGGSRQEAAGYRFANGSFIAVAGMDNPTKIMSSEFDMIYVQEAIELTETDWEALTTRLRNNVMPYQQLIADTNPDKPTHWLNQRCQRGVTTMIHSRWSDNPTLYDKDGAVTVSGASYLAKLDNLTGVRKLRLQGGKWVAAEGVIWEGWDDTVHLIDKAPIPWEWPRWWSVDFGYVHPFVCQRWAEDPDGRLILYGEIYMTRRIVEDHAALLKALITPKPDGKQAAEPRPRAVICDHDAEDRATLERHLGMSTRPAKKSVSEGLQAVASRLKVVNGRPRLQIMRNAVMQIDQTLVDAKKPTCTEQEIPGYVWADTGKEQPVKVDDDGCDALRYMVAQLDTGVKSRVRILQL